MTGFLDGFRRGFEAARAATAKPGAPIERDEDEPADGASDDDRKTVAEVAELAEKLQARVDELEAESAQIDELRAQIKVFTGVLKLPGVKTWVRSRFHPDSHPGANEEERRAFKESAQIINAAYEFVERQT
jgi:hypothetical protein